jgi:hypothetical protein
LEEGEIKDLARIGHGKRELVGRMLSRRQREDFVAKPFETLTEDEKDQPARAEFMSISVS